MRNFYINFRSILMLMLMLVFGIAAYAQSDARVEALFAKGQGVNLPVELETDGVKMTTEGRDFMGVTIDVSYNTYGEGELDWNNGTKLIFEAKDKITGIVMDGQWLEFASCNKGIYTNGRWDGTLAAGDKLVLTANDGILIHSIKVCYNGAEVEDDEEADENAPVTVEFLLPESLPAITDQMQIANFTVTKAYYDIRMNVTCEEDPDFSLIGSCDLAKNAGTFPYVVFTPNAMPVILNKDYHYRFAILTSEYGWDEYVEIASCVVVGSGPEPQKTVDIAVTITNSKEGALGYFIPQNQTIEFAFSMPVKNFKAYVAMGLEGSKSLSVEKVDEAGKVWSVDVSSMASMEGAFNLNITAYDAETGYQIKGENADHTFAFNISTLEEIVPIDKPVATLTIDENTIILSETEAIELASYPESAILTVINTDEAIKKISYEIVDATVNEIYKSVADLTEEENGVWTAVMPKQYDFATGHEYKIHIVARDGMSSFTSKVLYEYNFIVNGIADVATYSTVRIVSVTPDENVVLTESTPVITIAFSEAIKSLDITAVLGQMSSTQLPASCISTEDGITWTVNIPEGCVVDGTLSLNFIALDNEGNRVTDSANGVGTPETCYVHYGWAATVGLPTPELAEAGKTLEAIESLTFTYEGIGLNTDNATSSWNRITIAKDGAPLGIVITEDMFKVSGDESVGGTELTLTLPVPLAENGVYTVSVPAYAFMLGHEQSNFYSGDCQFDITVETAQSEGIELNIIKTDWATIGSETGEIVATIGGNFAVFDHFEAEIRCAEDPEQYISFPYVNSIGGKLICWTWEGGHYDLNAGYHYSLIVKAFTVPYYGAEPVAETVYEFVGTGVEIAKFSDIELANVDLEKNSILYHGYNASGNTFDVTFSAPVSKVAVWWAKGQDGAENFSAEQKSEDGTVWTIIMPESITSTEGSINVMIQAWDAEGVMAKGENGDNAFALNLFIAESNPDDDPSVAIKTIMANPTAEVHTLTGVAIKATQMQKGNVYIINGKKVRF